MDRRYSVARSLINISIPFTLFLMNLLNFATEDWNTNEEEYNKLHFAFIRRIKILFMILYVANQSHIINT